MIKRRHILSLSIALAASVGFSGISYAQETLPQVTLQTMAGNIVVEVDTVNAPATAANFLQYVKDGHYNGTIFHRVIGNFMIQGGGMLPDMSEKATRAPIKLEKSPKLLNVRGSIAMARTNVPDSATSQFFINVVDNAFLNGQSNNDGYAVFGHVVSGMEIVDKIRDAQTHSVGYHNDVPVTPIIIEKASVTKE